MKKHIGFLIMNFANKGGTERVTSIVANELSKRGYKVSVISCQQGEYSNYKTCEGVELYSLHGENKNNSALRKVHVISGLKNVVKNQKIDVMIAVDVALYLYLLPLQLKKICKCVAWEHFNYFISGSTTVKYARKIAAKYADCVVVLGQNDYNNYKSHYKKINRIEYIYNPIALNLNVVTPMTSKRIIAVGRLSKQKGFDLLIDAWARIEKDFPEWRVDIYGDGSLKEELQQQIQARNLNHIRLCGYAADIEKEYLTSSIFALSSRFEGFVLVLMEAQAKGLPCVSFNCKEGPAETIDDGVNGYLVKEGDIEEFAEKLKLLMDNDALRKEFASKAKKDLYRFETSSIIDKWELLFTTL